MPRLKASPGPTARRRAAKARRDARYAKLVREKVANRDVGCRVGRQLPFDCAGQLEWAHIGDKRRFKTRGLSPQLRHHTRFTMMLCTHHHRLLDAHRLTVIYLSSAGCDGPVRFEAR